MPIPSAKPEYVPAIHDLAQAILESTQTTSSEVLLNGLMSAYFSAAVNRCFAADAPAALRVAADEVEIRLDEVVKAKALIDAQSVTKN